MCWSVEITRDVTWLYGLKEVPKAEIVRRIGKEYSDRKTKSWDVWHHHSFRSGCSFARNHQNKKFALQLRVEKVEVSLKKRIQTKFRKI